MRTAVGAVVLLAGALAGCTAAPPPAATEGPTTAVPSRAPTLPAREDVPLPPLEDLPSTMVPVEGEAPGALTASPDSVWVQSHRSTVLSRIDIASGKVVSTARVEQLGCGDIAWGDGALWQTGCGVSPGLVRVDGATGAVTSVKVNGLGPAVLDGSVWVGSADDGSTNHVHRFATTDLREGAPVPVAGLDDGDGGTVAAAGSIWTTGRYSAVVHRIDPASGEVVAAVPLPTSSNSGYLTVVDDAPVWTDPWSGLLAPIDPATDTGRILRVRTDKPSRYWGVAASAATDRPGHLWVRSGEDEVWLVDIRADRVVRRLKVDVGRGGDVQQTGDVLWVSSFMNDAVERIPLSPNG